MPQKIPTIVGIFSVVILVATLTVGTHLVQNFRNPLSQAQTSASAQEIEITNITDHSATITWTTDSQTLGSVAFGKSESLSDGVAVDDRNLNSPSDRFSTHFVRLSNLNASTKYFFRINPSGENAVSSFTTGPAISNPAQNEPIFGKVLTSSNQPAVGIIVLWESAQAGKISSLTKDDGSFVLPLAIARSIDLVNPFSVSPKISETITFLAGTDGSAKITCHPGKDMPLPTVKIGETLDCDQKPSSAANSLTTTSTFRKSALVPPASSSGNLIVNIQDKETVSNEQPTFSGRSGANQIVNIKVESDPVYSGTVKADPAGNWSWTPPANLAPGEHTVTITIVGADGSVQTIKRTFVVQAGSPILPITSGTPSATLTHFGCSNNSCTQFSGAGSDSCVTDSDCVATSSSDTQATVSTPPEKPPQTGAVENTIVMLTLGLLFVTLGVGLKVILNLAYGK